MYDLPLHKACKQCSAPLQLDIGVVHVLHGTWGLEDLSQRDNLSMKREDRKQHFNWRHTKLPKSRGWNLL